ncbi:NEW3 domain-containing protein [Rugosimonospora africana]|uniref:F5/8 type C domain-containing protein n=1 Tax=Rugosimonospora africana TaxID=556532 RepID=A0A8J3QT41_9ACTN|nr:NEW3 domain-containing protein [Rugosimonospora africana]GIH15290.1 hypothetical protein Raf01_34620 [Rugosimonospora africana]
MSRTHQLLRLATALALAIPGGAALAGSARAATPTYQPLPTLPINSCNDSTLPKSGGTNAPLPSDPYGYGFANESAIGWQGNYYAPLAYLSGAYFARGVPTHYVAGKTTYCGAMYSFNVYNYGLAAGKAPAPGSVTWSMSGGYLPALTTSFSRAGADISITDFANQQKVDGAEVELVYTRITVHNTTSGILDVPSGQSGPNLVSLDDHADTVAAGATVTHDFVAAVDTFNTTGTLPTAAALAGVASYDDAFGHMSAFWNNQLKDIPRLSLPNLTLPNTGLANPGDAIDNAYKAAFVYTRIVQVGEAQFSGANNYDSLLNHDVPSILANRLELGDYADAQNLLLTARVSEASNFNEQGANWYWDGPWKTPATWGQYLEVTGDTSFVNTYFHDDASGPSPWGPSLYTLMHTDYLAQLSSTTHYLRTSGDNDSSGTWLFDDEAALAGLASYKYITTRIGNTAEAQWADGAYTSLLNATNAGLSANEQANGFKYLPCEVNVPSTADRCNTKNDANWAGSNLWSQNVWDIMLAGGTLGGVLGDQAQTDNLYTMGMSRLQGSGVPFPSFGAYSGYSVALNTGYAAGGLYGTQYRDLALTSYAWQIQNTTGGPNAWWEANGSAPDPNNPWAGSHAAPQFGAVPYVWPMASQTQTLVQALAAPGLVSTTNPDGTFDYHTALYVGRGIPDAWLVPGQHIDIDNLTSSYDVKSGARKTYGVDISVLSDRGDRVVTVNLPGKLPSDDVRVQLPSLASAGVKSVTGGAYDPATQTVTVASNHPSVRIRLGGAARPTVAVNVASTVPGQHSQPTISAGSSTTATATVTNPGATALTDVKLSLDTPTGWTVDPGTPATIASIAPGASATVTWTLTTPSSLNGSVGIPITTTYASANGVSGSVGSEPFVTVQRELPVPPGSTNLATGATPSASYTSPWENVKALNDGIYPPSSNDSVNLRWGDWPEEGPQWVELDWSQPITTNGSGVYFFDDGGGIGLPTSWTLQYWNGTDWTDVSDPSAYTTTLNTFNQVSFDPVTTTKLRISLQSAATTSVGVLEWLVDSVPGS